jgi:hypothetical protein
MPTELADGLGLRDVLLYSFESQRYAPKDWFPRSCFTLDANPCNGEALD